MNQQAEHSFKSSLATCMNDNHTPISKESISSKQKLQNMPNVIEITKMMLGIICKENAKKMTHGEIRGFYNIANGLTNIISELR